MALIVLGGENALASASCVLRNWFTHGPFSRDSRLSQPFPRVSAPIDTNYTQVPIIFS